mgnify:CR=1 FL=1
MTTWMPVFRIRSWSTGLAEGKRDMDRISRLLSDSGADILPDTYDVTGGAHPDQLAIVGLAVKDGVNGDTASAEYLFYIEGNFHISAVHIRNLLNYRIE